MDIDEDNERHRREELERRAKRKVRRRWPYNPVAVPVMWQRSDLPFDVDASMIGCHCLLPCGVEWLCSLMAVALWRFPLEFSTS